MREYFILILIYLNQYIHIYMYKTEEENTMIVAQTFFEVLKQINQRNERENVSGGRSLYNAFKEIEIRKNEITGDINRQFLALKLIQEESSQQAIRHLLLIVDKLQNIFDFIKKQSEMLPDFIMKKIISIINQDVEDNQTSQSYAKLLQQKINQEIAKKIKNLQEQLRKQKQNALIRRQERQFQDYYDKIFLDYQTMLERQSSYVDQYVLPRQYKLQPSKSNLNSAPFQQSQKRIIKKKLKIQTSPIMYKLQAIKQSTNKAKSHQSKTFYIKLNKHNLQLFDGIETIEFTLTNDEHSRKQLVFISRQSNKRMSIIFQNDIQECQLIEQIVRSPYDLQNMTLATFLRKILQRNKATFQLTDLYDVTIGYL